MKVYCPHGRVFCVVDANPGHPELRVRTPRWRDELSAQAGIPGERDNARWRLDVSHNSPIRAEGCRECGPRELPVRELLIALEAGELKYVLT